MVVSVVMVIRYVFWLINVVLREFKIKVSFLFKNMLYEIIKKNEEICIKDKMFNNSFLK